ncbi:MULTISPECIES: hypothetical protein [unclassified Streptomyces]|uniref:hypothetical protein n=1 Tax=unclassified Streptomyces TaxID=2593676 RepID=UPI00035F4B5E|nr:MULTISPECIES: hypothetical protein [unclassified Streptomyces]MYY03110.1 hypothetical protein [Streptomyces sp. SID4913]
MKAYKVKGTTDEVTTCELCGKQELKGTVMLMPLDVDGNEDGDVSYFGTSCAAKAAGWTVREVNAGVKAAKDEDRARRDADRRAAWAAQTEFLAGWYLEHYGTTDLHKAAELAGVSTVRLSGAAIRAYREVQSAAESVTVVEEPAVELAPVTVDVPAGCPVLAEPGNIHCMTAHCVDCNAFRMAKMNVDTVESWYRSGHFSQDEYEAFMHAWATDAYRYTAGGHAVIPTDPKVVMIVAAIRRHADITAPITIAA